MDEGQLRGEAESRRECAASIQYCRPSLLTLRAAGQTPAVVRPSHQRWYSRQKRPVDKGAELDEKPAGFGACARQDIQKTGRGCCRAHLAEGQRHRCAVLKRGGVIGNRDMLARAVLGLRSVCKVDEPSHLEQRNGMIAA